MYNIAITKDKETKFFDGTDSKPRSYPTLADALMSAQYLGLAKQDVELHFIKEGTSNEAINQTTTGIRSIKAVVKLKSDKHVQSGKQESYSLSVRNRKKENK
jgi:hypothetical protein